MPEPPADDQEPPMELPHHRETEDPDAAPRRDSEMSWGGRLVVGVLVTLIVVVILLHLTGVVGPGAH